MRKLEKRVKKIEEAGTVPQLQSLINQIIELIRGNQKIVNEVVKANAELRNELSKLPPKIDDVITTIKNFVSLVEAAGREELTRVATGTAAISPETFKPMVDQLQKIVEQNQRLIENNRAVLESLEDLNKKMKRKMPATRLFSSYPPRRLKERR